MIQDGDENVFRFGGFVLDLSKGQLLRGESEIKVRAKVFEFLLLLVKGRGRLFSKDELIEALWPDTIASEDSLVQLVSTLRSALGTENADILVTVPKRGYRLGVPVSGPLPSLQSSPEGDIRYAVSGGLSIAYQVVGDGPIDVVYIPGWVSHLEYGWESNVLSRFYRGLASFSRLILFDKRGTGLSDRAFGLPTTEQRMDDVRAVMDAAGSKKAAILAMSEGGGLAITFAATQPERVHSLVLFGVFAKREWSFDYPWAPTPAERQHFYDEIEQGWGGPIGIESIAPSCCDDEQFCAWWATYQRRSASPAAALSLARMNTPIDVINHLGAVQVPTLVMHRVGDREAHIEEAHYLASHISRAELCELPGEDHLIFAGDQDAVISKTREFISR